MSPTVLRVGNYRFFFFSREEARMHVHIVSPDGEAKFWLEPITALAAYTGFPQKQLRQLQELVETQTMRSLKPGSNTSKPDIVIASKHGFWLILDSREYFLPFEKFPWFRGASESELRNVEVLHGHHLHWPSLEVDLTLTAIEEPDKYELVWE